MDSGSSAAGGSGSRVAPSEGSALPPVVGDERAAAFAEAGVTVHPTARVAENAALLQGATVGPGAVVSDLCLVGSNALVSDGAILEPFCVIGDRAVIGSGARIGSATTVDSDATVGRDAVLEGAVQVAPGVTICDGACVTGPQAVWPDHPAAVLRPAPLILRPPMSPSVATRPRLLLRLFPRRVPRRPWPDALSASVTIETDVPPGLFAEALRFAGAAIRTSGARVPLRCKLRVVEADCRASPALPLVCSSSYLCCAALYARFLVSAVRRLDGVVD